MLRAGFLLVVFYFTFSNVTAQINSEKQIITEMLKTMHALKNIETDIKVSERNDDKLISATPHLKVQLEPRKVYVKLKENGAELLWSKDVNKGKALVNPNGFPFINLSLDIDGYFLRDKKHHTLREAGFKYFAELFEKSIKAYGDKFYDYISYKGTVKWNNKDCYIIVIDYVDFKYVDHKLNKDEDLVSLARRLNVSEHMIKEKNDLGNYDVVAKGKILKVPTWYAKKITLYIDKELMLPIYQKIEDDKGVYELYEYSNLKINQNFTALDFSDKNEKYGF